MSSKRILVVDDEEGMLEVCEATLRKLTDATIFVEQDSNRAAERVESENFDLLILDIRMTDIGGVELLRRAREHDPHVPVLRMTACPSVDPTIETSTLGETDYITQPFLPKTLPRFSSLRFINIAVFLIQDLRISSKSIPGDMLSRARE